MTEKTAVMLCGQSSGDASTVDEFNSLAAELKRRLPGHDFESGFLGTAGPGIQDGLETLATRYAKKIICIPAVLFCPERITKDLSAEIDKFSREHAGLELVLSRELSMDSRLLAAARDRIEQVEQEASNHIQREETLLMVVGPGSDDSKANSDVAKFTRLLWEGMGFGWAEASYLEFASPSIEEGLAKAAKLGFKRIVVFPCFMFYGDAVRHSYAAADDCMAKSPSVEVLKAMHLCDPGGLADSLTDRIEELLNGIGNMNCLVCTYREQIIDTGHDHEHAHGHDHHHRHHHHGDGDENADHD